MLIQADARSIPLRDGCVQCVVTSPPYFGLRDYGTANQIGLEPSPDAYVQQLVAVFREVRRVLADDGVLWLNLGDSYTGSGKGGNPEAGKQATNKGSQTIGVLYGKTGDTARQAAVTNVTRKTFDIGPKQLLGIPWRVAFALQQPYYAGIIKNREDRIWLAAMLDAEGCLFIHKRKAGQHNGQGYYRQNDSYGPGLEIANTSLAVVERIMAIVGKGSICSQGPDQTNGRRRQTIYRWNLRTLESRDFVRELYPHLIAKQHQARLLYGCPSSGRDAERAHAGLMALHRGQGTDIDFPAPPSMFEPGWYLRSDVIWSKANPIPESVTDRPTKAHEYLFLLAKSERYYYDGEAVREPNTVDMQRRAAAGHTRGASGKVDASRQDAESLRGDHAKAITADGRNKRSVWTVPTMPYSGAHFATMPEKLVEPCILAGSRFGDLVFDPFIGSGTVGAVAERLGRRWVGLDLNFDYLSNLAKARTFAESVHAKAPLFAGLEEAL